ncbi:MAG: DUF2851 family protein [Cyclobacteriaceae bacterium]
MTESFLHYIWQMQYFDKNDLCTVDDEPVTVFQPGFLNTNAGPDFSQARIRIGSLDWSGQVEIHVRSSEWDDHAHRTDHTYDNVILHVVWEDNRPVLRADGTPMPTLLLKGRVNTGLLHTYQKLMATAHVIPCQGSLAAVPSLIRLSMIEKSLVRRLQRKATEMLEVAQATRFDWDETAYRFLARNFGFKINADPFFELARRVEYRQVLKIADRLGTVEALLFGQAGFLEAVSSDEYVQQLKNEYRHLAARWKLEDRQVDTARWKFLRLRPANFPTLRLAQFCAFLNGNRNLFSSLLEWRNLAAVAKGLSVAPSAYWHRHYHFGKQSNVLHPAMGQASVHNIVVNTLAPLWVAYGLSQDDESWIERAVELLRQVPAESNAIIKKWKALGWAPTSAADTQGLIELFNEFCQSKNCLNCAIGASLIKPA